VRRRPDPERLRCPEGNVGNAAAASFLLEHNAIPDAIDARGRSALLLAARGGHLRVMNLLKGKGAQLCLHSQDPTAPFSRQAVLAAMVEGRYGESMAVKSSIANLQNHRRLAWMEGAKAASAGDIKYLAALVNAGLPPDETDAEGRTALHVAVGSTQPSAVACLLELGADPNVPDNSGNTPLLLAAKAASRPMCRQLAGRGAVFGFRRINWRSTAITSPREVSGKTGRPSNAATTEREMCDAIVNDDLAYLQRLLDFGADPNDTGYNGRAALHSCAMWGGKYMVYALQLVRAGADIHLEDRWGNTPLSQARAGEHDTLARALVEAEAEAARAGHGRQGGT